MLLLLLFRTHPLEYCDFIAVVVDSDNDSERIGGLLKCFREFYIMSLIECPSVRPRFLVYLFAEIRSKPHRL